MNEADVRGRIDYNFLLSSRLSDGIPINYYFLSILQVAIHFSRSPIKIAGFLLSDNLAMVSIEP
jgi:hypothetical protein